MRIRGSKIFGLLIFTAVLSGMLTLVQGGKKAKDRDFISYWAAGRLLRTHHDPYDTTQVLTLERSIGYVGARPLVMRNPPIALPLTLLLGYLPMKAASALWMFFIVACLILSVHMIRDMYGNPSNGAHLFGYLFAPCFACLIAGQSGMWMLLGLTVFLRFYETQPLLAGAGLAVCAIKPHLFLPFALVMLLWAVKKRQAKLFTGAVVILAAASVLAMCWRPAVWGDYLTGISHAGISNEFIPTVSTALRLVVRPRWVWLQYLPCVIACIWAVVYFKRNSSEWNWRGAEGSLLVLASLWVSPYSWPTDEVIALPALLGLVYILSGEGRRSIALYVLFAADAIAMVGLFANVPLTSGLYIWTTTVWLGCYLLGSRSLKASVPQELLEAN